MEVNRGEDQQHDQASSHSAIEHLKNQGDWLEKTRGNLMVAATVIASMSFQVMINPPGGVWQGDTADACSPEHQNDTCYQTKVGTSVLQANGSAYRVYNGMVISSTISFTASMSLILLVISGFRLRNRIVMVILGTFMVVAVVCMSASFFFAVMLVQSDNEMVINIMIIYILVWFGLVFLIILVHIVRGLYWLIRRCCCPRPTPRLLPVVPPPPAR